MHVTTLRSSGSRSTGNSAGPRVRFGALAAAVAVAAGSVVAGAIPAAAEPVGGPSAAFTWQISPYVASWLPGGIPGTQGSSTETGNVIRALDGTGWTFTAGKRTVTATGVTTIAFDAEVDLRPYSGYGQPNIQILLVDPILTVDLAGAGTLTATVSSVGTGGSTSAATVTLADFVGATMTPNATDVTAVDFAATPAYAGTVPAGTYAADQTDAFPVSFITNLDPSLRAFFHASNSARDGEKLPAAITGGWTTPSLAVDDIDGELGWGGTDITVTGKNFDKASPGFYIGAGPADVKVTHPQSWYLDAGLYSGVQWIQPQAIGVDGSFVATLSITPIAGVSSYAVYTFKAHGSQDRSQDAVSAGFTFEASPFADVTGTSTFGREISWLVNEGVINGYPSGGSALPKFKPETNASRAAAAAFFFRLDHPIVPATMCEKPFPDVAANSTFCNEISWAVEQGLLTGYRDGKFKSGNPISRGAFAALTYRYLNAGADAPTCTVSPFVDVKVDNSFCGEIAWLAENGITQGYYDGTFRQTEPISRQAIAAFIYRLVHLS